jgi:hypothetical protein
MPPEATSFSKVSFPVFRSIAKALTAPLFWRSKSLISFAA